MDISKATLPRSSSSPEGVIYAAGGLVWRFKKNIEELAVVHRTPEHHGDWCLPKGKPKSGESLDATALREVKEETGCDVRITSFAGVINYMVGDLPKVVLFWNMELIGECSFKPSSEVGELEWLSRTDATKRIEYKEERELIERTQIVRKFTQKNRGSRGSTLSSIFSSLRRRRLAGSLDAFASELGELICRERKEGQIDPCWIDASQILLSRAQEALGDRKTDEGWKLLHAAIRMRVHGMTSEELMSEAAILRAEAEDKLESWRQKAIFTLIGHPLRDKLPTVTRAQLYAAMLLRDEHFNNLAYKDNVLRHHGRLLASILFLLLTTLFLLFWFSLLPRQPLECLCRSQERWLLLGMILFGLLGSTFSAATKHTAPQKGWRIPETVNAVRTTLIRIGLGAVSAFVVYLFVRSGLSSFINISNVEQLEPYTLYVFAIVSGFSERFALSAIEKVVGKG